MTIVPSNPKKASEINLNSEDGRASNQYDPPPPQSKSENSIPYDIKLSYNNDKSMELDQLGENDIRQESSHDGRGKDIDESPVMRNQEQMKF